MHIFLKTDVDVRLPDGSFHTLFADTSVNYSCKRNGDHWIHKFVAASKQGLVEHMTVCFGKENPPWL
jgi:hypothetical protein